MNSADLFALSPILIVTATPVVIMLMIAFYRNHFLTALLTVVGLALSLAAIFLISPVAPSRVTPLILVDGYALFFMALIFATTLAVTLLSYGYLNKYEGDREEFYVLLLTAALGAAVMVSNGHFSSFFVGLETLNISLYVLIAYLRKRLKGIEAGMKYLILAAMSDAFLLFGMALVYAQIGTMDLARLEPLRNLSGASTILVTGLAMLITGIGFKLAVVPFHIWTPDVYEGAPAPVTAFIATVSKGAMFVVLFRYLHPSIVQVETPLFTVISIIAIASMFVGNLLALLQNNVKRILAYSSIAHMGYLLVAFLASNAAVTAVSYYLVAYFVTTLGAFGVITVLSGSDADADRLEEYRGLAWRRPWLSGVFTAMLLSLAGIPLTAGFVGKFYVMAAGIGSALWLLVTMLVINSAIGLYYYLRIIVIVFSSASTEEAKPFLTAPRIPVGASVVLAVLTLLLLLLGVYPAPVINVIQTTAARLI
jgi:NADH-quinone oxidoreductase subunit N